MMVKCQNYHCVYNGENDTCFTDVIAVKGKSATSSSETLCGSFTAKAKVQDAEFAADFLQEVRSPAGVSNIECEASQCMYNQNLNCHAEQVDINEAGAKCITFKK